LKSDIKQLSERVEKLSEEQRRSEQAAFKARWFKLSETERQLALEVINEFASLRDADESPRRSRRKSGMTIYRWRNGQFLTKWILGREVKIECQE
jgi:hypothetical protein